MRPHAGGRAARGRRGHAAAAARAADLPLRRGRLRRADGDAACWALADARPQLALGPQDGVLAAGLARVRRAAGWAPARCGWRGRRGDALAVRRRGAAAAGLCRVALRARSAAAPGPTDERAVLLTKLSCCWSSACRGAWHRLGRSSVLGPPPRSTRRRRASATRPQTMVACAHCGVHLPQHEACADAAGLPYCSDAHRLAGPALTTGRAA